MARIVSKTVYSFSELSDSAKERARDWWRDCENQDFDTSCVFEDAVKCAELIGITIKHHPVKLMNGTTRYDPSIYYEGFCVQGSGACFDGSYAYVKGAAKAIRQHAPQDEKLHAIADSLQAIQRKHFYRVEAEMRHAGRYMHSGYMNVEVTLRDSDSYDAPACEDHIRSVMRDFADWIYSQLEAEYTYRMSDENVDESIEINEYEFNEDGSRA